MEEKHVEQQIFLLLSSVVGGEMKKDRRESLKINFI